MTERVDKQPGVTSQRLEGVVPDDPEGLFRNGLKLRHWVELNHSQPTEEERTSKLAKFRAEYVGNPIALQQIDVFDGNSIYNARLREHADALKSGDTQMQDELETWFKEHYPDI